MKLRPLQLGPLPVGYPVQYRKQADQKNVFAGVVTHYQAPGKVCLALFVPHGAIKPVYDVQVTLKDDNLDNTCWRLPGYLVATETPGLYPIDDATD